MGKAGQTNFTGLFFQVRVAFLYLLQSYNDPSFQFISIEEDEWEDFTLHFSGYTIDFECKYWPSQKISTQRVLEIIKKEISKQSIRDKDSFKIVVNELTDDFKAIYNEINKVSYLNYDPFINVGVNENLSRKGWSETEVRFLCNKTEIREFSIKQLDNKISEFFTIQMPFYLDQERTKDLINRNLEKIIEQGRDGGRISKEDFAIIVKNFTEDIATYSTDFDPGLSIKGKIVNIQNFLQSPTAFQELNKRVYLTAISLESRIVFYIERFLRNNDFAVSEFDFFINKILIKNDYNRLVINILELKWAKNKAEPYYLIDFIISNYRLLNQDFGFDRALSIIERIAEKDLSASFMPKIIPFLRTEFLKPLQPIGKGLIESGQWQQNYYIGRILAYYFNYSNEKIEIINLIFEHFDLCSGLAVHDIPIEAFDLVSAFLILDLEKNYPIVLNKVNSQFNLLFGGKFKGSEWLGSTVTQMDYSITLNDSQLVSRVFGPAFKRFYNDESEKAWIFLIDNILVPPLLSENKPILLQRAIVPILFDRLEYASKDEQLKEEIIKYLIERIDCFEGIPDLQSKVFNELRTIDLEKIGVENVFRLVEYDIKKGFDFEGSQVIFPSNQFSLMILLLLINQGYVPARNLLLQIVRQHLFSKLEQEFDILLFEHLFSEGVVEKEPEFIFELIYEIDLVKYLTSLGVYAKMNANLKSRILTTLFIQSFEQNKNWASTILKMLLNDDEPQTIILEFVNTPLLDVVNKYPLSIYSLMEPYILNEQIYKRKFINYPHFKETFIRIGEELVKIGEFNKVIPLVEKFIYDPDPDTDLMDQHFGYHQQIKNGVSSPIIASIRGKTAWLLKEFSQSDNKELHEFAVNQLEILLDLNGTLAVKLGYSEPDLYVRLQSVIALGTFARVGQEIRNKVKQLGISIIEDLRKRQTKDASQALFVTPIYMLFQSFRDLDNNESKLVLDFLYDYHSEQAIYFFIFYALDREKYNNNFDSAYAQKNLSKICTEQSELKIRFAIDATRFQPDLFRRIEKYWKLLFLTYDQRVYPWLYRYLPNLLEQPDKYSEYRDIMMQAIKNEIYFYKDVTSVSYIWPLNEQIWFYLYKEHLSDFLEAASIIITGLVENRNISYTGIDMVVKLLKEVNIGDTTLSTNVYKSLIEVIRDNFPDIYY